MLSHSVTKRIVLTGTACIVTLTLPSPLCPPLTAQQVKLTPPSAAAGVVFHSPQPDNTPGEDSSVIYRSFFNYHHILSDWIDSQTASNPGQSKKLVQDAAKLHRIQEAEYDKVAAISHSVASDLKQVETDANAYLNAAKSNRTLADSKVLRQYEHRRRTILSGAIRQLQSSLGTDSWKGLHSYLNEEHRTQIHTVPTKKR